MAHIDCICPPKADGEPRHPDGDDVELRERLDFPSARAIANAVASARIQGEDIPALTGVMSEQFLLHGIRRWTVVDGEGQPVEPSRWAIRVYLLENLVASSQVADEADALYTDVIVPLVMLVLGSSRPTPTTESTSPTSTEPSPSLTSAAGRSNGSSKKHRPKHSRPSSTSPTPTDDIETTTPLLVGASSFSPS